jgi:hypothetical protein
MGIWIGISETGHHDVADNKSQAVAQVALAKRKPMVRIAVSPIDFGAVFVNFAK